MSNIPTEPRLAFGYSTEERNTIAGSSDGMHPRRRGISIPNTNIPDPESYNLDQDIDYSRRLDEKSSNNTQLTDPDEFHTIDLGYEMDDLSTSAIAPEAPSNVGGWRINTDARSTPRVPVAELPKPVTQKRQARAARICRCNKRVFWSWIGVGILVVLGFTGATLGLTLGKSKQEQTSDFVPQATTFRTVGAGPPQATAIMTQYRIR